MKYDNRKNSVLKTGPRRFFKVGLMIAILAVIVAFKLPFYETVSDEPIFEIEQCPDCMVLEEVPPTNQKREVAPPKPPLPELPPLITPDPVPDPEPPTPEPPAPPTPPVGPIVNLDPEPDPTPPMKEEPVLFAQNMPEFPGGDAALLAYLSKATYCQPAIDMDIEGTVTIEFVVGKQGQIKDVTVLRGLFPCLDQICVNHVKNMPEWKPGSNGAMKVEVRQRVPFTFKLAN